MAEHLLERGAKVYVTDIREESVQLLQKQTQNLPGTVHAVNQNEIFDVEADVFVPCALGGVLNDATIPRLKVKAVVGSANNQLETKRHAQVLDQKGILYAPDFIVNAGGLIQVADELYGPNPERVLNKTAAIHDALLSIYEMANLEGITTNEAADLRVQECMKEQAVRNSFFNRKRSPKWNIKE
ncbi:Phenylalanine dehydrogenase [Lentibacillus sp. JNUCC-1]|nr:Phenylalanine dehydrogenase [Lentibacillus sp. JNUCC-1]